MDINMDKIIIFLARFGFPGVRDQCKWLSGISSFCETLKMVISNRREKIKCWTAELNENGGSLHTPFCIRRRQGQNCFSSLLNNESLELEDEEEQFIVSACSAWTSRLERTYTRPHYQKAVLGFELMLSLEAASSFGLCCWWLASTYFCPSSPSPWPCHLWNPSLYPSHFQATPCVALFPATSSPGPGHGLDPLPSTPSVLLGIEIAPSFPFFPLYTGRF